MPLLKPLRVDTYPPPVSSSCLVDNFKSGFGLRSGEKPRTIGVRTNICQLPARSIKQELEVVGSSPVCTTHRETSQRKQLIFNTFSLLFSVLTNSRSWEEKNI